MDEHTESCVMPYKEMPYLIQLRNEIVIDNDKAFCSVCREEMEILIENAMQ